MDQITKLKVVRFDDLSEITLSELQGAKSPNLNPDLDILF